MSEELYALLLRLYPSQFRASYGAEAMTLFRDRMRDETGLLGRSRLWMDLLADLAISVPLAYRHVIPERSTEIAAADAPAFQILTGERPRPEALVFGVVLSLVLAAAFFGATRLEQRPERVPSFAGKRRTFSPTRRPITLASYLPEVQEQPDTSSHTARLVEIGSGVKLEVLDWGGTGRPLILLAGMGNTAHIYDSFAPKLTAMHHVYGITRRGFGVSSRPEPTPVNYSATRLGDDVLAVMDSLQLTRPVLVGHSLAGEELSSIGSRYPAKIAGAVYLDAGYGYAFYDREHGDLWLDLIEMRKRIDDLQSGTVSDRKQLWLDMLANTSHLQQALTEITTAMKSMPSIPSPPPIPTAVMFGTEKFTNIPVPILAIFAVPGNAEEHALNQIKAFEAGVPSAHIVRLANANHYVFRSNEADVLREMNDFLSKLK